MCQPVVEEIRRRVGNFVYGVDVETLEELVVNELRRTGKKLATAESCTGGLLGKRITDISGSSDVFEMGCITYANSVKEQLLGVPHETLEQYGAVSEQTARAMAEGIVRVSGADLGVGITGIAGPGGGTPEKPVGLVYIALSDGENTWVAKRMPFGRSKSREFMHLCADIKHKSFTFENITAAHNWQHPKNTVAISLDGKKIGEMAACHPTVATKTAKKCAMVFGEIDMDDFADCAKDKLSYVEPSKYPSMDIDLSFVINADTKYSDIASAF